MTPRSRSLINRTRGKRGSMLELVGFRQRYRGIVSPQEFNGHENEFSVADVFDCVDEEFVFAVAEMPCLSGIMIDIDDPPVLIVAACDAGGGRRPEIIQDMPVK